MSMADERPSRKRLTAATKHVKDVEIGEFVRLKGHRGLGVIMEIANSWARVRWQSGERSGTETDHPLASLRRVRGVGSRFDHR